MLLQTTYSLSPGHHVAAAAVAATASCLLHNSSTMRTAEVVAVLLQAGRMLSAHIRKKRRSDTPCLWPVEDRGAPFDWRSAEIQVQDSFQFNRFR